MPCVLEIEMDEFQLRVTTFIKSLGSSFTLEEREQLLAYVEETLTADDIDDTTRRRAIVQKLIHSGCRQCVKGLVRRGKKLGKSVNEPPDPLARESDKG